MLRALCLATTLTPLPQLTLAMQLAWYAQRARHVRTPPPPLRQPALQARGVLVASSPAAPAQLAIRVIQLPRCQRSAAWAPTPVQEAVLTVERASRALLPTWRDSPVLPRPSFRLQPLLLSAPPALLGQPAQLPMQPPPPVQQPHTRPLVQESASKPKQASLHLPP